MTTASPDRRRSRLELGRWRRRPVGPRQRAGGDHNLAISADGAIWSWGGGDHGKLGHGDWQIQWSSQRAWRERARGVEALERERRGPPAHPSAGTAHPRVSIFRPPRCAVRSQGRWWHVRKKDRAVTNAHQASRTRVRGRTLARVHATASPAPPQRSGLTLRPAERPPCPRVAESTYTRAMPPSPSAPPSPTHLEQDRTARLS